MIQQLAEVERLLHELGWADRKSMGTWIDQGYLGRSEVGEIFFPVQVRYAIDWNNPECRRLITWGLKALALQGDPHNLMERVATVKHENPDKQWQKIKYYLPPAAVQSLIRHLDRELEKQGKQLLLDLGDWSRANDPEHPEFRSLMAMTA